MAELVPGVSGGTIALVTGIYGQLLHSVGLIVGGVKLVFSDRAGARDRWGQVDWRLIVSVAVGMGAALFFFAGLVEKWVTDSPVESRSLFFGMVLASLFVPLSMVGTHAFSKRPIVRCVLFASLFALAALCTFFATGSVSEPVSNPPLPLVFLAGAIAVCALVLPGVSGSFFLLAIGLYSATLGAVHDLDFGYLAVFAAGACVGFVTFVQLLNYLLDKHRTVTLIVMSGLMLGSLRALWPWQSPEFTSSSSPADDTSSEIHNALLAPSENVAVAFALMVAGFAVVAALVLADRMVTRGSR